MKKPAKNILTIAAIGAGLGYLAGLLTAKKPGSETRQDIVDTTKKVKDKTEATMTDLYGELTDTIKKAEAIVNDKKLSMTHGLYRATTKAERIKSQAEGIISAVKTGKVSDKDLHKSIEDLKSSISSLKKYFQ